MFTNEDIKQIEARGLSVADVERQIENFRNGFPSLPVASPDLHSKAMGILGGKMSRG